MRRTRGPENSRRSGVTWLVVVTLACAKSDKTPEPAREPAAATDSVSSDTGQVTVTRPTVIAYFLVPRGAVDTMPNLAVEADDWSYAMAMLRDSLEGGGIDLAIAVEPLVRIDSAGGSGIIVDLGPPLTAGYVFVRLGEPPCIRRGGMDQADLLATARSFFGRPPAPLDTSVARCTPTDSLPTGNR